MPKFNKAFYLCLGGDQNESSIKQSYYTNNADKFHKEHLINFTPKYPRKLIPTEYVPSCVINFAYDGSNKMFSKSKKHLNIDPTGKRTNTEIATERVKKFFKDIVPYSVIYIDTHASPEGYFGPTFLMPDGKKEVIELSLFSLAELLSNCIPEDAKNNLKIHLIVCYGSACCEGLMQALDNKGFSKTSVVGYTNIVWTRNKHGVLTDFSSVDRMTDSGIFKHGKNYKNNKVACHNYKGKGNITLEDYKKFKQDYLIRSLEKSNRDKKRKIDIDTDKERKIQLINLLSIFLNMKIKECLECNKRKNQNIFHFKRHNSSGRDRASFILVILEDMESEIRRELFNLNILAGFYETKLIKELKEYASKTGDYSRFSGNINVNDSSSLSYILNALHGFYLSYANSIESNVLKEFGRYLTKGHKITGHKSSPNGIFNTFGSLKNDKEGRNILKNALINLPYDTINKW